MGARTTQRDVALITAGTVIGQAFVLASTPVLSRIYRPEDIGCLAVFTSIAGLCTITAGLHYELAIPLPRSGRSAAAVSLLATVIVTIVSALVLVAVTAGDGALLRALGAAQIYPARYLLALSVLFAGITNTWTFVVVRYRYQRRNALSKALQGILQAGFQLGAGLLGFGWQGLVAGQALGAIGGAAPLFIYRTQVPARSGLRRTVLRMLAVMRRYRNFALAAAPASLINAAATQLPALLFAAAFGFKVAGLYGMSFRIMQLPSRFIGQAISQVFFGHAADAANAGSLGPLVGNYFRCLLAAALHTFIPLAIVAQPAFRLALGPRWDEAGRYVQWLTPWILAGFIVTPMSLLVAVLGRQRQELKLQVAYLAVIGLAIASGMAAGSETVTLAVLGLAGGAYFALKGWWLAGIAGCDRALLARSSLHELLVATIVNLPVWLLVLAGRPDVVTCLLAGAWAAAVHVVNLRMRRVYDF